MSKDRHNSDDSQTIDESREPAMKELNLRSGLAVAGTFMAWFVTVGFLNAFGVFQDYYAQDVLRDRSAFEISWLGSFANFSIFLYSFPVSFFADRVGPTIPMAFGSIAMLVAVFMISLCEEYYQFFLAQGVLLGLGMCLVIIPPSSIISQYFVRYRGAANGISIAGSSLGGVLWPIIFDQLFRHDGVTFGWSMRIAGFIMMPLLAFALVAVQPPFKPVEETFQAEAGEKQDSATEKNPRDLSVLCKAPFIFLCLGLFVYYLGFFAPIYYISVYAEQLSFSPDLASYLISILNAASLFGRILPGMAADHVGRFNMITMSAFSAAIVGFCWSSATSVAGVVVWATVYGFTSGAVLSLQFACATTLADKDAAGIVVGTTGTAFSLGILLGTPISGEIVERGYLDLSIYTGVTLLASAGLLFASRLAQDRDVRARI